ncbi:patatin-like phospholipase family protein [Sphingomonas rubra]|uniref:patatin-like phospholipase family protein n=1 Tax=Sphingomonas rubra TaxID=634430 RepID=UPI000AC52137|nr:patatin-like phospholipase family protein [Sphingomonas rubra]
MIDRLAGHRIALVLAGGNALGAYQAGAYQVLHEHGIEPDWIVGTSAGAINGAVIAGNAPRDRVARLESLWRPRAEGGWPMWWEAIPETWRRTGEALTTMLAGRSGLFAPAGSAAQTAATPAIYDTAPMRGSLAHLVDFERLNAGHVRYGALAVDLGSGRETLFDTAEQRIDADHIRASAAMPPTFPAVPIGGRLFVDGGLSANLPIDAVLGTARERPVLCIAIDLLPDAAPLPQTLGEVIGRTQDLLFSGQSRRAVDRWRDAYATDPDAASRSVTLVRLSYTDQRQEVAGKAMDFSPATIRARWNSGMRDAAALVTHLTSGVVPLGRPGLSIHDIVPAT